ncbi:MAG: cytochrome c3 family protein [Bdellovibrionales bacterium]|nr:cytochrome c3 family protein [Bdellovibrionales bacterium]
MDRRYVVAAGLVGLLILLSVFIHLITNNKIVIGYNKDYAPDQPIPFSHEIHAGEFKVDCQYCHAGASVSRHATVPSLNICMNCHLTVNGRTDEGKKHVERLREAFNNNEPIEWKKVHLLPDHVKFNHAAHIAKGKACQTCHGPVETMEKVYQWSSLSMGWCVNCHREPENNAPINCSTCHY